MSTSNSTFISPSWYLPTTTTTQLLTTLTLLTLLTLAIVTLPRLRRLLTSPPPTPSTSHSISSTHHNPRRGHLMIILGSGGHTAEMFSVVRNLGHEYLDTRFSRRTWVVSSGDGFSERWAREFEGEALAQRERVGRDGEDGVAQGGLENGRVGVRARERMGEEQVGGEEERRGGEGDGEGREQDVTWKICTVRRARRVHQSLLSTPISSLGCLWDCIRVLRGDVSASSSLSTSTSELTTARLTTQKSQDPFPGKPNRTTTNSHDEADSYGYPDLILTNGPGTGVIMVLASLLLLFFGVAPATTPLSSSSFSSSPSAPSTSTKTALNAKTNGSVNKPHEIESRDRDGDEARETSGSTSKDRKGGGGGSGAMRTIYIESWARVKSLSLSCRILRYMASRVLVQWRGGGRGYGDGGVVDLTRVETVSGLEVEVEVESKENDGDGEKAEREEKGGERQEEKRDVLGWGMRKRRGREAIQWPRKLEYIGGVVT